MIVSLVSFPKGAEMSESSATIPCPVCERKFLKESVEEHVNKCLFLNSLQSQSSSNTKRDASHLGLVSPKEKRLKFNGNSMKVQSSKRHFLEPSQSMTEKRDNSVKKLPDNAPLAESVRPAQLDELVGQVASFGPGSMLRSMLEQKKVPNMILWGPPGCGKTSLANIVGAMCKGHSHLRFVKLSATMAGINDVKEVVKIAKNEAQYKRQTILFMDEIHRFNKLQQDTFLPHVESGTIVLMGATTENPSFSLNNALLSRCRVVVMEKLSSNDVSVILERALERNQAKVVDVDTKAIEDDEEIPRYLVERESVRWLADVCDGDARVALGALELALAAREPAGAGALPSGPALLTLQDMQDGIKRSHMLYDRRGDEHYNIISALHKSVRAGDDNAALYWTTRALHAGEDPLYIARRLVRAACEDIGLGDPSAVVEAVACLQGCQQIGAPECGVLLAQCAVRLARADKSTEVYHAMKRVQSALAAAKGPLPSVPLHLRNAPTDMMRRLGYGREYNTLHKDESGLTYMPEGMEDVDFFTRNEHT